MIRLRPFGVLLMMIASLASDSLAQSDTCPGKRWSGATLTDLSRVNYSLLYENDRHDDFESAVVYAECLRELKPWASDSVGSPFDSTAGVERYLDMAVRVYEQVGRPEDATTVVADVINYLGPAERSRWEKWLEERR